jgi:hypothetical protein
VDKDWKTYRYELVVRIEDSETGELHISQTYPIPLENEANARKASQDLFLYRLDNAKVGKQVTALLFHGDRLIVDFFAKKLPGSVLRSVS